MLLKDSSKFLTLLDTRAKIIVIKREVMKDAKLAIR